MWIASRTFLFQRSVSLTFAPSQSIWWCGSYLRYLNFRSNHHPRILTGVLKCLKNHADRVCDEQHQADEANHLWETFHANGYPMRLIKHRLQKLSTDPNSASLEGTEDNPSYYHFYISKASQRKSMRRCKHLDVRTVFKSSNTLRNSLVWVKTPSRPPEERSSIRDPM